MNRPAIKVIMRAANLKTVALLVILLTVTALGCVRTAAQSPTAQRSVATGSDKLLSLGDFYLRSDDVTDAADQYYKRLVNSFPGTRNAGVAQYKRGVYWQKKFYILKQRNGKIDRVALSALTEAEGQFYDFIDKFAASTNTLDLLADAEFSLAFVYLQKNQRKDAIGWLNQTIYKDAKQDGKIYIYRVVWSTDENDVLDRNYGATQLAQFTRDTIEKGLSPDQVISQVTQWCRRQ